MRVVKFVIENYKALRGKHEFDPGGASFLLLGGNGKGKSSAGHALIDILTKKFPSKPVTEGEKEGYIEFEMDNGAKLYARLSQNGKPKIEFITPEGFNVGSPKELLTDLAGDSMTFSIDEFLSMQPKPRRELLERIVGIDLTDLNEKEAEAFDRRRDINAKVRDQQGRVQPYEKDLVGKEPVNTAKLSEQLQQLENTRSRTESLTKDISYAQEQIKQHEEEIERLQARIATFKESIKEYKEEAKSLPDVAPEELESLKEQLATADDTNMAIERANRLHEEYLRLQELETEAKKADDQVKRIRAEKDEKLKSNPLPAEGMEFSEDGILLDGLPFEDNQIATSRKVIAGLQIQAGMLGKVKFCHLDAAVLDRENAERVLTWAEENGLQLCVEKPLWDGGELKFEVWDKTAQHESVEA